MPCMQLRTPKKHVLPMNFDWLNLIQPGFSYLLIRGGILPARPGSSKLVVVVVGSSAHLPRCHHGRTARAQKCHALSQFRTCSEGKRKTLLVLMTLKIYLYSINPIQMILEHWRRFDQISKHFKICFPYHQMHKSNMITTFIAVILLSTAFNPGLGSGKDSCQFSI